MKFAVITDADGDMGTEITRAATKAGYRIVMVYYHLEKTEKVKDMLVRDTGSPHIGVLGVDLPSFVPVAVFAEILLKRGDAVGLLMNNAGAMEMEHRITEDGLEYTISVDYMAPYLLTHKLLLLMGEGSRIASMMSCTYAIGHLDLPDLFSRGRRGGFWRIPVYNNTKLALTLFTTNLAARVRERGTVMNAVDPEVVSTNIITMHMQFDPLTDIFFRPFIRTPKQGVVTAIHLLPDEGVGKRTSTLNVSYHLKRLSGEHIGRVQMQKLWNRTEKIVEKWL